jgi:hypothetical protein
MLFSQIRDTALARTEGKAKHALNLDLELLIVIQQFCQAAGWGWKQKKHAFNTVDGLAGYTLPADVDTIAAVHVFRAGEEPRKLAELFDQGSFINTDVLIQKGMPLNWYRKPSDELTLMLDPVPNDIVFAVTVSYDAVPVALPTDDVVPIVPAKHHKLLVKGLEKTILRYTLGEESAKYQTVSEEYAAEVAGAV